MFVLLWVPSSTILCRGGEKKSLQKTCFSNFPIQKLLDHEESYSDLMEKTQILDFELGSITVRDFGLFWRKACFLCVVKNKVGI